MPNFYLQPTSNDQLFFELHATTDISVSFPSKVTSYPIETGQEVTDNIVLEPVVISFTGVITDVGRFSSIGRTSGNEAVTNSSNSTLLSIEDYVFYLRKLRDEKEVFSVFFSLKNSGIDPIDYAILTGFELTKSSEQGSSWSVNVELQEVRFANKAEVTAQAASDWQDIITKNEDAAANTGGTTGTQKTRTEQGMDYSRVIDIETGEVISTKFSGGHVDTGTD